jgi:hypothetical protein
MTQVKEHSVNTGFTTNKLNKSGKIHNPQDEHNITLLISIYIKGVTFPRIFSLHNLTKSNRKIRPTPSKSL